MSRLVDPVHFFNSLGRSVLTQNHLERENARLEKENGELKRRLQAAVNRLRELSGEPKSEKAI